uniref:Single domain-containing protein n=1 Tax=Amblyomma cajennense TaxID=34607 RepID=A0A023FFW9_AMBCJ
MRQIIFSLLLFVVMFTNHSVFGEKVRSLKVENGICYYRDYVIYAKDWDIDNDPCEKWICDAEKKQLTVKGCDLGSDESSCVYYNTGRGYWPRCCKTYGRVC